MNEECIVRKLISDGDGSGDDRRYISLLSALMKPVKENDRKQSLLLRISKTLDTAEVALRRQVLMSSMNESQITEYSELNGRIGNQIKAAVEMQRIAKKRLTTAKGSRRNKEEYELSAKMINDVPSRDVSYKKLESIRNDLEELHEKQHRLEVKLADRRNQLHAFDVILNNLSGFLQVDNSDLSLDGDENATIKNEKA